MKIMVNGVERDATDEEAQFIQEYQANRLPANLNYEIPKMTLWVRLSDEEAESVAQAMATQPARMQGIWNSASLIASNSEFFGTLQTFLTAVLGADRAAQLLQP